MNKVAVMNGEGKKGEREGEGEREKSMADIPPLVQ